MTNNPITTSRVLHYKPRNTNYRMLHHNVKIKSSDGSWELGCVYQDKDSGNIYTRPYSMFDIGNWEIVK
ncbi:hypothetical protein VPLG_00111 [Vibrio phage eugene 12A10]|uniref:hypothetical protein n=1 Tax=Vibrio phage eugene 12A10 TaxID=573172 RepID=UPI000351E15D|nr:hypothetical protein VPLG_00111 [Vibrio phage eugene 12A10]AGN51550.1 hypothetical protein VPLG_00111 [Vibrio phage eugene 12A10]